MSGLEGGAPEARGRPAEGPGGEWVLLGAIGLYVLAYWLQVRHLEPESIAYPVGLIVLLLAAVGLRVLALLRRRAAAPAADGGAGSGVSDDPWSGLATTRRGLVRAGAIAAAVFLFASGVERLGFGIAMALLVAFAVVVFGAARLPFAVLVGAVVGAAMASFLVEVLMVPVPRFPHAALPFGL